MSDEFESEMDAILLEQLINWCEFNEMNWHRLLARLVNDRDRLRAERDEARRMYCEELSLRAFGDTSCAWEEASIRSWDCFEEVKP